MSPMQRKQARFTQCLGKLIEYAYARGFKLTMAEGYVGDSINEPYEKSPHLRKGGHFKRLAQDLNLFVGDELIDTDHPAWHELGGIWKTLDPEAAWGGDFGDLDHFSFVDQGVK